MVIADGLQVSAPREMSGEVTIAPKACREFEASVVILHHSTTIGRGYQPVIHCGVLRQLAEMIGIKERETRKTGERATVRFLYFAEYVLPGSTFIFREGRAKGIDKVLKVFPLAALAAAAGAGSA